MREWESDAGSDPNFRQADTAAAAAETHALAPSSPVLQSYAYRKMHR